MALASVAVAAGLVLLAFGADRFVAGSAAAAAHWRMPPLLIGMLVVGFGTSAPELVVSAFAALQGTPGMALGNAYGSNIANIALILGLAAVIRPIRVHSRVLVQELPILVGVTVLAAWQISDGAITRLDSLVLIGAFAIVMGWTLRLGMQRRGDALGIEMQEDLAGRAMPLGRAVLWLLAGLGLLIASSRALVWGAVEIARGLGVSDVVIGLTVVAVGTSLPELASSLTAARKGEHDLALGNVLGSNLFNTLLVVGLAAVIRPIPVSTEVLFRDVSVMAALTLSLFVLGRGLRGPGRINRIEGSSLLVCYVLYTAYLVFGAVGS